MHSARRKWFENWIDYAWIDFFMVVYIAITNLLTMRISSYDWKMTANIDIRKQSWQCFMSLILPTFLISRPYDTWFCPVLFHVHIIERRRFSFYGLCFEHFYTIQVYDIHFLSFLYTIYRHVHNVAFTFEASKEFIGIHISCLQLQLSMLCNEMVFRRSWYTVIHW